MTDDAKKGPPSGGLTPKRTGTIHRYAPAKWGEPHGHYVVRCSAPDGTRPLFHLDPSPQSPEHEAAARATAGEITEGLWALQLGAAPKGSKPAEPADAEGMERWLAGWLADRKRRGYTSTPENESHYRQHIEPAIGPKHVRQWTADDLRLLTNVLDGKVQEATISWKMARNVWGTATKMCKDAMKSKQPALRVRDDNQSSGVEGPDRGAETVKQYLYPSEFERFVSCKKVPLGWRRAVALAVYLFPRAGEMRVLRWEDVDLDHGTVHIHRARDRITGKEKPTKTGVARRFAFDPNIRPLLEALSRESGGQGMVCPLPSERDMARGFRRWLKVAKVERQELHTTELTRKAITFHDLRATGLTWLAVRGDDSLKIMQRAGHLDFETTQGYIRTAEAVREGFGTVFPVLPASLLRASEEPGDDDPPERTEPLNDDSNDAPERLKARDSSSVTRAVTSLLTIENYCGADGTRTRGLRRDRPAL